MIKWKEVEYRGLTSAATSISQGFSQFYMDLFVASTCMSNHFESCHVCDWEKGIYCSTMEKEKKEITERLSTYEDFFKVIDSLEKIFSWVGRIVEEGDLQDFKECQTSTQEAKQD